MSTYSQSQLGLQTPEGGFQKGGWYEGRQYWNGTFSDPGVIHPMSNQQGAGQLVSPEINLQSDQAQGLNPGDIEKYLAQQRQQPVATQANAGYMPGGSGATMSTGMTGAGFDMGAMQGMQTQATLNLPEIQQNLMAESGISDREATLVDLEGKYLEAKGEISDNPFLSASQLDQRLQRLQRKYDEETAPIRSEIAMKKADIETQLNLQMKQFDIDTQAQQNALNYFNTLLDAGALSGASGETIAQITRATGIPSELLMNAVKSSKDTQLIQTTADSGEVTATLIDKQTGTILNQQSLGMVGNAQNISSSASKTNVVSEVGGFLASNTNSYGHVPGDVYLTARNAFVAEGGGSGEDFDSRYSIYRDPYNLDQYQVLQT